MTDQKPRMDVRAQIASWPDNAPRGAVAAFCRKHGISKAWFYKIRSRAVKEGQLEAMRLKSTRPNTVYLGFLMRLSGQLDIFRLMTRGLALGLRGGRSSWRTSAAKARKLVLAGFRGGKSRAGGEGTPGSPEGPGKGNP